MNIGGGTGGGLGCKILASMRQAVPYAYCLPIIILPSQKTAKTLIEYYNPLLSIKTV
jgi:hypothetical protein